MARGRKCKSCGHYMYAEKEKTEKHGTTVWYRCRNGNCPVPGGDTEMLFEPK